MTVHVERASHRLKQELMLLGSLVEESVFRAVKAVQLRDQKLAEEIFDADDEIDRREVDIEEECLKILALHQPTGTDLRLIMGAIKMTNELERIGDLAVKIGYCAHSLSLVRPIEVLPNFDLMARCAKRMLRCCLEAVVDLNVQQAWEVLTSDDEIDVMNRENFNLVQTRLEAEPTNSEALLYLLTVSQSLERIADHATNIAEDVIYMVQGEIVRHGNAKRVG